VVLQTLKRNDIRLVPYVPDRVLTNDELSTLVDTSDEWIMERTGIRERRIAAPEQALTDLALPAARTALAQAGLEGKDLDLLLCATVTPDMMFPSTACLVQHKIGAKGAWRSFSSVNRAMGMYTSPRASIVTGSAPEVELHAAVNDSFGFGGQNAVIAMKVTLIASPSKPSVRFTALENPSKTMMMKNK